MRVLVCVIFLFACGEGVKSSPAASRCGGRALTPSGRARVGIDGESGIG